MSDKANSVRRRQREGKQYYKKHRLAQCLHSFEILTGNSKPCKNRAYRNHSNIIFPVIVRKNNIMKLFRTILVYKASESLTDFFSALIN